MTEDLRSNSDAVIRNDDLHIQVLAVDQMVYQVTKVVTVFNASGKDFAEARIRYDKEIKVKHLEAVIYNQFGGEIETIKKRDFKDIAAADGFSLYRDDRVLYADYDPSQYPYTMKFTYEVETSDTGAMPQWYFVPGYGVGVEKSTYKISYASKELEPIIKEQNLDGLDVNVTKEYNAVLYVAKEIPAFSGETLSPSYHDILPRLSVRLPNFHFKGYNGAVNNWQELGHWVQDILLDGRDELDESTIAKMRNLVKGIDDDLEKAKIIYRYVQENTRYVSVQIGIGGLRPINAIEVDRDKYGDCKGLTNYTKALLKAVGVDSYYAVVESGRAKIDMQEDFADLIQGNHVILAIPYKNSYYWVDCTSQINPFGYLGDFTDDRTVLVVTPDGGKLVRTVSYLNKENAKHIKSTIKVFEDLSMEAQVMVQTKGIKYDLRMALERQSSEHIKDYYKTLWDNINGIKVKNYSFENNKDDIVFTEQVNFHAENFMAKNGEGYLLSINPLNNDTYVPARDRDRKYPFLVQRGAFEEDEIQFELPEGFTVSSLPEDVYVASEFGSYQTKVQEKTNGTLIYNRSFFLKAGTYKKESYQKFRSFLRTVARNDNQKIVLYKHKP
ncbi:DUF3857 domain-containing transglutaminase family protein [Flagellimonas sp. GZD32]|uniref:DUF3857 domain-containing transglutaminase family protein n=1 Tax=Flagellimonas cixiensis TaxID=3228750 RepID=UPI0035C91D3E